MKIAYCIIDHAYKRVFESFKEHNMVEQFLICRKPSVTTNLVPEGYDDCGIKKKFFISSDSDIQKHINKIKPDVYVQPDLSAIHKKVVLPKGCKRVFVSHGIIAEKQVDITKKLNLMSQVQKSWDGFDLYCGATDSFKYWLENIGIGITDDRLLLDALPQLDILHNPKYYNDYKVRVLKATNNSLTKKVILFFGNRCSIREDYIPYNKDYFDVLFKIEALAKKNNWATFVKPKIGFGKIMRFLKARKNEWGGWPGKYISKYSDVMKSKHIHIVQTNSHPYRYFFADVIVSTGGASTIEVDAAAAAKANVTYRPGDRSLDYPDPLRSIEFGSAINAESLSDLEPKIIQASLDIGFRDKQSKYLKAIGITNDGLAYKRIIDRMVKQWK